MTKKKHSASSKRWLKEHFDDQYVQKAQKMGLRSRAVFKLESIQEKDKLIKEMKIIKLSTVKGFIITNWLPRIK